MLSYKHILKNINPRHVEFISDIGYCVIASNFIVVSCVVQLLAHDLISMAF